MPQLNVPNLGATKSSAPEGASTSQSAVVPYRQSGGGASHAEMVVIGSVRNIVSDFSEDTILREIRKRTSTKGGADAMMTSQFTEEICNSLLDQAKSQDVFETPAPRRAFGPAKKVVISAPAQTDAVIPYNTYDVIDENRNTADKEENDLQRALQASLMLHPKNMSPFVASLPKNREELIKEAYISTGLHNAGNTCWFNCVTQLLYHLPQFRVLVYECMPLKWLEMDDFHFTQLTPDTVRVRDLLLVMRRQFAEMEFSSCTYVDTWDALHVVDALTRKANNSGSLLGQQQDAAESLMRVIDWLWQGVQDACAERLNPAVEESRYIPEGSSVNPPGSELMDSSVLPPAYTSMQIDEPTSPPAMVDVVRPQESRPNSPTLVAGHNNDVANNNLGRRTLFGSTSTGETFVPPPPGDSRPFPSMLIRPLEPTTPNVERVSLNVVAPPPMYSPAPPTLEQFHAVEHSTNNENVPPVLEASEPMETSVCEEPIVTQNDVDDVNRIKEQLTEIFEGESIEKTYGQAERKVKSCPLFFTLLVPYGDIHDALEAATFDSRLQNPVENWFEKLPAVLFMSLSRFSYENGISEKLHNRFVFPRSLFMDRYLQKNSPRVLELRKQRMKLRRVLAETRAKLRGLQDFPHGSDQLSTIRLADAFELVSNVLRPKNVGSGDEEMQSGDPPTRPFFGPVPQNNMTKSFVEDLGRIYPTLESGDMPDGRFADLLMEIRDKFVQQEKELAQTEKLISSQIDDIYNVPELHMNEYKLHAVMIHSGEVNRGHYWAFVRAPYKNTPELVNDDDIWERLNDKHVSRVDWEQVESDAFGCGSATKPSAYCLMYVREDARWLLQHDELPLNDALKTLPEDLREWIEVRAENFAREVQRFRAEVGEIESAAGAEEAAVFPADSSSPDSDEFVAEETASAQNARFLKELRSPLCDLDLFVLPHKDREGIKQAIHDLIPPLSKTLGVSSASMDMQILQAQRFFAYGGMDVLSEILRRPIDSLTRESENDAFDVFNQFVGNFFEVSRKWTALCPQCIESRHSCISNFMDSVGFHFPGRAHRYVLVYALAHCDIDILEDMAHFELNEFRKNSKLFYETSLIARWISLVYETVVLASWGCNESLIAFGKFRESSCTNISSLYQSMQYAQICRFYLHAYAKSITLQADSSVPPNTNVLTMVHVQMCTLLPLVHMSKNLLVRMTNRRELIANMEFTSSTNTRGTIHDIGDAIVHGIRAINHWIATARDLPDSEFDTNALSEIRHRLLAGFELVLATSDLVAHEPIRVSLLEKIVCALNGGTNEWAEALPQICAPLTVNIVDVVKSIDARMNKMNCMKCGHVYEQCDKVFSDINDALCKIYT